MTEKDSLSNFDFSKVSKPGKYLKFEAGKPVTVRILTKDPVIQEKVYTNKQTGETNLSTKFCFIVWNFTDEVAQILSAGPKMAKTFQRIATDEDFGADLQKCDIKISPEGEVLERVYDINVVRHSGNETPLTAAMVEEAKQINLDKDVQDNKGRLSEWEPAQSEPKHTDGVADAPKPDVVIDDIPDEPINLDNIPF